MIEKRERKRRDGRAYSVWRVRWYDPIGRERSRTFDRSTDAHAFEAKVRTLKRADDLSQLDAGKETLAEFAAEWWELYAVGNLARNTLKGYAASWNTHLLPRLGGYRLRDLSPPVVVGFRTELETAGVGRDAIRKALAMLQGILQRAVEWERIQGNPVKAVRKPRPERRRAVRPLPPATVEGVRAVLLDDGRLGDATLVSMLAYAGLRPQEALAAVGARARTNAPGRTGARRRRPQGPEDEPAAADRRPTAVTGTRSRRVAPRDRPSRKRRVRFSAAGGGPWRDHDWRNCVYVPAATAAGEAPRPYDLRHSFASLLIHEGRHSLVDI